MSAVYDRVYIDNEYPQSAYSYHIPKVPLTPRHFQEHT